ncbi:hypothetical protein CHS0354_001593 [Potamilus streckersoni]|uniref:Uncharacterized protein n=1 Tax=Potamilus streckersoni TaxID=2493646 RepID=A0AAE0RTZ5_9BIVA|nr:hypothetical protein CHS0354_001593 [Potamilus streckersoni]
MASIAAQNVSTELFADFDYTYADSSGTTECANSSDNWTNTVLPVVDSATIGAKLTMTPYSEYLCKAFAFDGSSCMTSKTNIRHLFKCIISVYVKEVEMRGKK